MVVDFESGREAQIGREESGSCRDCSINIRWWMIRSEEENRFELQRSRNLFSNREDSGRNAWWEQIKTMSAGLDQPASVTHFKWKSVRMRSGEYRCACARSCTFHLFVHVYISSSYLFIYLFYICLFYSAISERIPHTWMLVYNCKCL